MSSKDLKSMIPEVIKVAREALQDEEIVKSIPPEYRFILEIAVENLDLLSRILADEKIEEEEVKALLRRNIQLASEVLSRPEVQEAVPKKYRVILKLAAAIINALASALLK